MTSDLLVKAIPWGIAAVMAGAAYFCLDLYQHEHDEFVAFKARIDQAGKDQREALGKLVEQREETLKQARKDYEERIPAIRDAAVNAYRLRFPNASSCPVSGNAPGVKVDDGASPKCVADEFIRDAAEDAAKVTAWQDYCKRNNCPIKE